MDQRAQTENLEIDLLLEGIFRQYGYDFRNYAKASIRRRVRRFQNKLGLETIAEIQHRVLYEDVFFDRLLLDLTVNVTEMFRDPDFFKSLRHHIIPHLKSQPFIKIWHAGCSTGEEVYSMAILLKESGLYPQTRIYATDANESVLAKARKGIFALTNMQANSRNYIQGGGTSSLSDYFHASYDHALFDRALKANMVFSDHNLVTDGVFGEMDLILCRNVLIYFDNTLQNRVLDLFTESLRPGGFLCLGPRESIRFSLVSEQFENATPNHVIYRKILPSQAHDPTGAP